MLSKSNAKQHVHVGCLGLNQTSMLSLIIPKFSFNSWTDCAKRYNVNSCNYPAELEERLLVLRSEIESQEERAKSAEKEG